MDKYKILKKYFGYTSFRYPQDCVIDSIMNGYDTIALLPTGFGKSVTFQIPALMLDGITIVISPLIALMQDQVNNLKNKGICAEFLCSTLSLDEQKSIFNKMKFSSIKLLYVSPERLENTVFLKNVSNLNISLIVVDEAHTILWGEGFRSSFTRISDFIINLKHKPRVLALTATATSQTITKIIKYLNLSNVNVVEADFDRENLLYKVIETNNKKKFLLEYLKGQGNNKGIIYCLTRKKTEEIYNYLINMRINCTMYHGGLSSNAKRINQEAFTNDLNLIICTNAFGMGIDIPNIRFIICYEMPISIEDLVQQLGRGGRDGAISEGIVLFSFNDLNTLRYFIYSSYEDNKLLSENLKKMNKLVDYCLYRGCRHQFISKYFGQKKDKCKQSCDNCLKKYR